MAYLDHSSKETRHRQLLWFYTPSRLASGSLHASDQIERNGRRYKRIDKRIDSLKMTSALAAPSPPHKGSRSASTSKVADMSVTEIHSSSSPYPGSLNRHSRNNSAIPHYRSMLDIETSTIPTLGVTTGESMEDWISGKLDQTARTHKTENWADVLCFYTATNGVSAAPTRASPAPNGMSSPTSQEIPQSVSSSDPKIAAQQASDMRNIVRRKLTGYVGFANLPNQWHRKSVRKGFNFNVMVVGKLLSIWN